VQKKVKIALFQFMTNSFCRGALRINEKALLLFSGEMEKVFRNSKKKN